MPNYRLYILDQRDKIVDRLDTVSDEDQAALKSAGRLSDATHGVEVWAGARKVGKVSPTPDRLQS